MGGRGTAVFGAGMGARVGEVVMFEALGGLGFLAWESLGLLGAGTLGAFGSFFIGGVFAGGALVVGFAGVDFCGAGTFDVQSSVVFGAVAGTSAPI